jgi:hypothetical protein
MMRYAACLVFQISKGPFSFARQTPEYSSRPKGHTQAHFYAPLTEMEL